MICDDEQDLLQLFGLALRLKYNVILTSTGEDCIDKFIEEKNRGHKVHLILLDYRLGDMLGNSVVQKIKEYGETKIILISAFDLDRELVEELKENKYIVKYLAKPIRVAELMGLVADIIS